MSRGLLIYDGSGWPQEILKAKLWVSEPFFLAAACAGLLLLVQVSLLLLLSGLALIVAESPWDTGFLLGRQWGTWRGKQNDQTYVLFIFQEHCSFLFILLKEKDRRNRNRWIISCLLVHSSTAWNSQVWGRPVLEVGTQFRALMWEAGLPSIWAITKTSTNPECMLVERKLEWRMELGFELGHCEMGCSPKQWVNYCVKHPPLNLCLKSPLGLQWGQ